MTLPFRRYRPRAFTLIELMVACAIFAILALVLLSIFSRMGNIYQSTEARSSTFRVGRSAVQRLCSELESLVNPNADLPEASQTPPAPKPPSLPMVEVTDGEYPAISFFAHVSPQAQPENLNRSDVCLVSYFVAADPTDGRKSLYRCLIPSEETFTRLKAGGPPFSRATDRSPNAAFAEPIAENVTDFTVKILDGTFKEIDPTADEQAYVEVTLSVIGGNSASAYFAPDASDALRNSVKMKEGRTFTLRARLPNPP